MDENRRSSDLCGTFSGRGQVTVAQLPSCEQEIYDFLFFKLYLQSCLYPELVRVLWQPVILKSIAAMVQRSKMFRYGVIHAGIDSLKRSFCLIRVVIQFVGTAGTMCCCNRNIIA